MPDVIEWVDGTSTYRMRGLRATGQAISQRAGVVRGQLDERVVETNAPLDDFHGPIAAAFRDQGARANRAVIGLLDVVSSTAATCLDFPVPATLRTPTAEPALPDHVDRTSSGADPVALRRSRPPRPTGPPSSALQPPPSTWTMPAPRRRCDLRSR